MKGCWRVDRRQIKATVVRCYISCRDSQVGLTKGLGRQQAARLWRDQRTRRKAGVVGHDDDGEPYGGTVDHVSRFVFAIDRYAMDGRVGRL